LNNLLEWHGIGVVILHLHATVYCHCLIAGNGDHVLFKKLQSLLVKGLARETVEWKRWLYHVDLLFITLIIII